jgi:DNA replication protein DnaC
MWRATLLDELGYVPMGKAGAELLFDVMSHAYESMSLIATTNLPFEQWTEVLDNERLTGATLDRLTHRCHIVETGGESYRLKDARRGHRTREVNKPESESSRGPEQTPVNTGRPGA